MCAVSRADQKQKIGRPKNPDLEQRRRAEILTVAARLFAERGFANLQVQAIADELQIGNGTVYRYYPTKEALFLAAVGRGLEELDAEMVAILADQAVEPLEQFRKAIIGYLRFFARRPEMAELFIQERAAFPKNHRPLYFTLDDGTDPDCPSKQLFERLLARGVIRMMPMPRFFQVIGDLLYGTILTNLLTGRSVDPDSQAEDLLDILFHGILFSEHSGMKRGDS